MYIIFENDTFKLVLNPDTGLMEGLYAKNDTDGGNFLISTETLTKLNFSDYKNRLLGSTLFETECGLLGETGNYPPNNIITKNENIIVIKEVLGLEFTYHYEFLEDGIKISITIKNTTKANIIFNKLAHFIPVAYLCNTDLEKNLTASWSMVPTLGISKPFFLCKKRSGKGPDYIVQNITGGMKAVGSACSYKNLFFEQTSPSLSSAIFFNATIAWPHLKEDRPLTDWQYSELYHKITLPSEAALTEIFEIRQCEANKAEDKLLSLNTPIVDFPPYSLVGEVATLTVRGGKPILYQSICVTEKDEEPRIEFDSILETDESIHIGPFLEAGERKILIELEDGQKYSVIFSVYPSMKEYIETICHSIYTNRFISDPQDPDCYGYRSISPQGESCGKGSALLLKNILSPIPNKEEIHQVEINTLKYIIPNWLDENLLPKKKYGSGETAFARLYDLDYIILQLYLLGTVEDKLLTEKSAQTYIELATKLFRYRIEKTPDKSTRELEEVDLAMALHWDMEDLLKRYEAFCHEEETKDIRNILKEYMERQKQVVASDRCSVTEIYFDNAGVAMTTGTLLSYGDYESGLKAAKLLLPNVAFSNDFRCYAPDRWWESQSPMYHNLWAVNVAKAMLQTYLANGDTKYLDLAYRSMMPMFHNYDWTAKSSRRIIEKGEGVSTYCITAPNLNHELCSHNRFGQQIFTNDEFINSLKLCGDDWDNGVDLVIYLQSFGQTCYVDGLKDNPYAVGGRVENTERGYLIHSFSAYPSRYYLVPWDMVIERSTNTYTIDEIIIKHGRCTEVIIQGVITEDENFLWMTQNQNKTKIYPQFTIK
jgi:hypothetical protein